MKTVLTSTLIALTLVLCGFNVFQWHREARLYGSLENLRKEVHDKKVALLESAAAIKRTQDEVARIDGIRTDLTAQLRTNKLELDRLSNSNQWLRAMIENNEKQVDAYKEVVEKANDAIKKQNEMIVEQNEKMLELVKQRDEFVERYKKLADDYNTLGGDYQKLQGLYEELVNRWNEQQTQRRGGSS